MSDRRSEIEQCEREIAFLEWNLARDPSNTQAWVLRAEIFQHLSCINNAFHYTTEQLFFGPFVAGLSSHQTAKAALSYSFLSNAHFKKLKDIAKDSLEYDEE